jgi:hypothetical protein
MNRKRDEMRPIELALDNVALALDECRADRTALDVLESTERLARDIYADGTVTAYEYRRLMRTLSVVHGAVEKALSLDLLDVAIGRELAGAVEKRRATCKVARSAAA